MTNLYSQHQALQLTRAQLGGKAANLLWLSLEHYPVPEWWVIPGEILTQILSQDSESVAMVQALEEVFGDITPEALETLAAPLRQRIRQAQLSSDLQKQLSALLADNPATFFLSAPPPSMKTEIMPRLPDKWTAIYFSRVSKQ